MNRAKREAMSGSILQFVSPNISSSNVCSESLEGASSSTTVSSPVEKKSYKSHYDTNFLSNTSETENKNKDTTAPDDISDTLDPEETSECLNIFKDIGNWPLPLPKNFRHEMIKKGRGYFQNKGTLCYCCNVRRQPQRFKTKFVDNLVLQEIF
ncbi:unnamed protein product [Brassicogethes aeneus]|uniref:Uncharacterized protein n=1 Tax=Brassicogethes aeneus TaxID=1431903 RepID=A0A9P0B255_BRAAE|nr:unnamed protein product [Brassicogethes aeneus]